jgi:methionine--tRNA ligase beta chain
MERRSAAGAPPPPRRPDIRYEDFAKIDLRVAEIVTAEYFKGKPNLIHLTVDLGYQRSEMIVGKGLPDLYSPKDLVGQRVVWMANLTAKKIVGGVSRGMIVAVGDNRVDGLVVLDHGCPLGMRVR